MMDEFGTFQLPYSNYKIKRLLNIAREIKRNKTILLREIKKATFRTVLLLTYFFISQS